jgi:HEAT repeat protein
MTNDRDALLLLLENLGDPDKSIAFSSLYLLSDLSGSTLEAFQEAWVRYESPIRRRLMKALVELAESSFEVHFDPLFRMSLADPDDEVRALALDGLWESQDMALIGPMLSLLRVDPSPAVRAAAATGLGRFVLAGELEQLEDPVKARIVTDLLTTVHLADESVDVRRRALEAMAYVCTPEVQDAIDLAYHHEDEQMRISAVAGMGRSCDRRWAEILLVELESSSPAMRYEAAWASGELRLVKAIPLLQQLIDDPDSQVRIAAIEALGQIGGQQARDVLLAAAEDADEYTLEALSDALAEQSLLEGDLSFMVYPPDENDDDDLLDERLWDPWDTDG